MTNSDLLFRILRDRAPALASLAVDHSPPDPFPHADPYLLSSTLQKAIRRGDTAIARRAGHALLTMDRSRLWRRLMVVALEDIGIADPDAAAELIAISTLPAARRLFGSDVNALDIALARSCAAAKDRSGDHLLSIVNRELVSNMDRAAIRTASGDTLLAMLASTAMPWERRLHAAVRASGLADAMHPGAPGIAAVLDVMHELGVPCPLLVACEAYAIRSRDLLPVLVPFAATLANTNAPGCIEPPRAPKTITHDLPASADIGGWPEWSFDPLWTRVGKRAVDLWLRSYLAKPQWLPRQVAACLWNSESAACDRVAVWPLGDTIRKRAHAADLSYRGLPRERHAELAHWIAHERVHLTCARQAAFDSAVRAAAKLDTSNSQTNPPQQGSLFKNRHA